MAAAAHHPRDDSDDDTAALHLLRRDQMTAGEAGDMMVTEGDEAGGAAAAGQQQGGGSAWRGADGSLGALVAQAPPVPPRLLASHGIWTAGGQGVGAAQVLWAAGHATAVVRAKRAEAQVATLQAQIYRLAAASVAALQQQARRDLDAGDGADHDDADGEDDDADNNDDDADRGGQHESEN